MQTPRINVTAFTHAFREWRYCRYEMAKIKKEPQFDCPACSDYQQSVHIDGNKKLHCFSKMMVTRHDDVRIFSFIYHVYIYTNASM